ncbi:MAG TPA: PQQ-binding-like beta-propeller repeat protein [Pyrinomonadaceae bacterium]|nr:PQQ-binding-like beta-propeller repeat protein [Pyrinomonadaceae bacterium]
MKRFIAGLLLSAVVCLAAVFSFGSHGASAKGGNWPQWRGPEGQGISTETGLPTEWSATKNIKWKTPITGRGHSSPIVWGKRIFLTSAIEGEVIPGTKPGVTHKMADGSDFVHPDAVGADRKHTFKVISLDRETGKVLWERVAYEGAVSDSRHKKASFASSTPATDGKYVFAFFGTEGLYAYDFNGKLIWKQNLGKLGTASVGYGVSPILYQNLVIMQCDESGMQSFIAAYDKKTGKEVWRVPRKVDVTWSTPVLVRTPKRTELIASAAEAIIAYDPLTGKELWRHKGLESNAVNTPVVSGDLVVITSGYPAKVALAIRAGGSGDITGTPQLVWKYNKGTAYVPSPILYGDYLYLMTGNGSLTGLDAKTGKVLYEAARVPKPAAFMASPVAFEDKLLLTSEEGDTYVIKAGAKHEVIRTNSLGEPVYASPAIADEKLFIRGEKHLYCIENARG